MTQVNHVSRLGPGRSESEISDHLSHVPNRKTGGQGVRSLCPPRTHQEVTSGPWASPHRSRRSRLRASRPTTRHRQAHQHCLADHFPWAYSNTPQRKRRLPISEEPHSENFPRFLDTPHPLFVAVYRFGNYLLLWRMHGCSRFFSGPCPGCDRCAGA